MRFASRSPRSLQDLSRLGLLRRYRRLDRRGDGSPEALARNELADAMAAEALRRDPRDGGMWFDRGLYAKWRRDWHASREHTRQAFDLLHPGRRDGQPAAWNLGIAATALRDWDTARDAWRAFGVPIGGSGDEPVLEDLGPAPVRLNPEPRHAGQAELRIDDRTWQTEVVWGRRLDPARIEVLSVPLPGSGHRHGDVVLHDGDPHGSRRFGDEELPVFDEIELWQRSPRPTLSAAVEALSAEDVGALVTSFEDAGLAAEDWTTQVRVLCSACSEGTPGDHDHPVDDTGHARTLGISAHPAEAEAVLDAWALGGTGRRWGRLTVELE